VAKKSLLSKQQGKAALSAAEMLLLEDCRCHLRLAMDDACKGDLDAACFQLIKVNCHLHAADIRAMRELLSRLAQMSFQCMNSD